MLSVYFLFNNLYHLYPIFRFQQLSTSDAWDVGRVESILLEAACGLPVEQVCLSYLALENILQSLEGVSDDQRPDAAYQELVRKLVSFLEPFKRISFLLKIIIILVQYTTVESRLILRVGMATKCSAWTSLPSAKQSSIMQKGFFNPIDSRAKEAKVSTPKPRTILKRHQSLNVPVGSGSKPPGAQQRSTEERPRTRTAASIRNQGPVTIASPRAVRAVAPRPQSAHGNPPLATNHRSNINDSSARRPRI